MRVSSATRRGNIALKFRRHVDNIWPRDLFVSTAIIRVNYQSLARTRSF